jgi:hypothetical protein
MPRDSLTQSFIDSITDLDKEEATCDTECFSDYWCIGFQNIATNKQVVYELYDGCALDIPKVRNILRKYRIYTFNGATYDIAMICLAMSGADNQTLKECNDDIIVRRMPMWKLVDKYPIIVPAWLDTVDLFDVAPGVKISLKKYAARMGMRRMKETPVPFDKPLRPVERPQLRKRVVEYMFNDLDVTAELKRRLPDELTLRFDLTRQYRVDVRSKSDAQIAEALISAEYERKTKKWPEKPTVVAMDFKYTPPDFIKFETPQLQEMLRVVTTASFKVRGGPKPDNHSSDAYKKAWGVVKLPDSIKALDIKINGTQYKMGIGGLHSKEKKRSFIMDEDTVIEDRDVRGYYPALMLACGFAPASIGVHFEPIFKNFVETRNRYKSLAAKFKKLDKAKSVSYKRVSDAFKIVNNGTFGKTGSPYSVLYAPKMMINVTITGQLCLLMLIERLTVAGFTVISANTDGIVTVIPKDRYNEFDNIVWDWEFDTHLATEAVRYYGVYSRDVNSYIALTCDEDGNPVEAKRKGLFAKAGLQEKHDPTFDICSTAVVNYLLKGDDIEKTIRSCADIREFVGVKQVEKPGGFYNGEHLGVMVRWYYSVDTPYAFISKESGARVSGTTGCRPIMDLADDYSVPEDLDYEWYVREAYARLDDIGLKIQDPRIAKRHGTMLASLPKQKTLHYVQRGTRTAYCERAEKTVRDAWQEHAFVPEGMRVCKTCREERGYVDVEVDQDAATA